MSRPLQLQESMPYTTLFCYWPDASMESEARNALRCVVDTFREVRNGDTVFIPSADVIVRIRRVHAVPASCPGHCVATMPCFTNRTRRFGIELLVDLRERRVLPRGVPGVKRVYRRLDWHSEDSPGAETCFVRLEGIATTSWRNAGLAHTILQLCDPHGPSTGACMVVEPLDFVDRMAFYE